MTKVDDIQAAEAARGGRRQRGASVPMWIAAFILILTMGTYFARGILLLFDLGVLEGRIPPLTLADGVLSPVGERLVLAGFYLFFGVLALSILIGFLRRRRWAWTAAMTWTVASLALNLVNYFDGTANYITMFEGVVMMLALNQAGVHRVFGIGMDQPADV